MSKYEDEFEEGEYLIEEEEIKSRSQKPSSKQVQLLDEASEYVQF